MLCAVLLASCGLLKKHGDSDTDCGNKIERLNYLKNSFVMLSDKEKEDISAARGKAFQRYCSAEAGFSGMISSALCIGNFTNYIVLVADTGLYTFSRLKIGEHIVETPNIYQLCVYCKDNNSWIVSSSQRLRDDPCQTEDLTYSDIFSLSATESVLLTESEWDECYENYLNAVEYYRLRAELDNN